MSFNSCRQCISAWIAAVIVATGTNSKDINSPPTLGEVRGKFLWRPCRINCSMPWRPGILARRSNMCTVCTYAPWMVNELTNWLTNKRANEQTSPSMLDTPCKDLYAFAPSWSNMKRFWCVSISAVESNGMNSESICKSPRLMTVFQWSGWSRFLPPVNCSHQNHNDN